MGWSETLTVGPPKVPPTQGLCTCSPQPGWVQEPPRPRQGLRTAPVQTLTA